MLDAMPLDDDDYRYDPINCPYCGDQTELIDTTIYDTVFHCISCGETVIIDSLEL